MKLIKYLDNRVFSLYWNCVNVALPYSNMRGSLCFLYALAIGTVQAYLSPVQAQPELPAADTIEAIPITPVPVAASFELKLMEYDNFSAGVQGSVDVIPMASEFLNLANESADGQVGVLYLPIAYIDSPERQFHITPGVALLSDRAIDFHDTTFTLDTEYLALAGRVAADEQYRVSLGYSSGESFQLGAMVERPDADASETADFRYALEAELRPLNRQDSLSVSARVLGERAEESTAGILLAEFPITYQGDSTALLLNPQLTAVGDEETFSLGVELNQTVGGVQLMGEVTPALEGKQLVWAVGARYSLDGTALHLDVYGTNAVEQKGGEPSVPRFGLGLNWVMDR